MTIEIPRSLAQSVSDNFDAEVEAHRLALMEHRFSTPERQAKAGRPAIPPVKAIPPTPAQGRLPAKPGRPGFKGMPAVASVEAIAGTPAPTANALIEKCIRRIKGADNGADEFVADYRIVDG